MNDIGFLLGPNVILERRVQSDSSAQPNKNGEPETLLLTNDQFFTIPVIFQIESTVLILISEPLFFPFYILFDIPVVTCFPFSFRHQLNFSGVLRCSELTESQVFTCTCE